MQCTTDITRWPLRQSTLIWSARVSRPQAVSAGRFQENLGILLFENKHGGINQNDSTIAICYYKIIAQKNKSLQSTSIRFNPLQNHGGFSPHHITILGIWLSTGRSWPGSSMQLQLVTSAKKLLRSGRLYLWNDIDIVQVYTISDTLW